MAGSQGYGIAQPGRPVEHEAEANKINAAKGGCWTSRPWRSLPSSVQAVRICCFCCEKLDEPVKEDKFRAEGFGNSKKCQVGSAKEIHKVLEKF